MEIGGGRNKRTPFLLFVFFHERLRASCVRVCVTGLRGGGREQGTCAGTRVTRLTKLDTFSADGSARYVDGTGRLP
eukprot:1451101-Prymnesium_polylepis.3